MLQPRGWQEKALDRVRVLEPRQKRFLLEATPGAGKTIFSAFYAARYLKELGQADFVVIVVPTTAIKGDSDAGFLGDWNRCGLDITTVLKDGNDPPKEFVGGVITYQQLPNIITSFEVWERKGIRIVAILDEIHHASEHNKWGLAVEKLGGCAERVLAMTGTPFRGDATKISFVNYDDAGMAKADYKYTYRNAVRDSVCRSVEFITDDGVAEWISQGEEQQRRLSEAEGDLAGPAAATIFRGDSKWLGTVMAKADDTLEEYRTFDVDAGGIIVCRPGKDDDDRYLRQTAKLCKKITHQNPEIISHEDIDANAKIERFRKTTDKWICAVRKISEGVDIKRLRVMLMATRPTTELLFRQLVGRVVRVDDNQNPGDATVIIAKFPQLKEWAQRIQEEAQSGLKDKQDRKPPENPAEPSGFVPLRSTHEEGGAISMFGETFNADEINKAESLKRNDSVLNRTPITTIAHILRKSNAEPAEVPVETKPLQKQKQELRDDINKSAKKYAFLKAGGVWLAREEHYKEPWRIIKERLGPYNINDMFDNYPIEVMQMALDMLDEAIANEATK